jgi:hypothetical protein
MPNPNRTRAILAAQKVAANGVRVKTDPKPEDGKLTPEQRRAMYAPKSALEVIPKRAPMPISAAKTTAKTGGVLLAMLTAITAGVMVGETKKGLRS